MTVITEDKSAPKYTWKFSERSLLIRFFLWMYGENQRRKLTFCRLFWGMMLSPFVAPVMALLTVLKAVGKPLGKGVDALMDRSMERERARAARIAAVREERKAAWEAWCMSFPVEQRPHVTFGSMGKGRRAYPVAYVHPGWNIKAHRFEMGAYLLMEGPPAVPPWEKEKVVAVVPAEPKEKWSAKFMESVAEFADKISAWFQAHPQIGQGWNKTTTFIGRALVRFVFYPLMVLLPLTFVVWVLYIVFEHRDGPGHLVASMWDSTFHFLAHSVPANIAHFFETGILTILKVLGAGLLGITFAVGIIYLVYVAEMASERISGPERTSAMGDVLDRVLGSYSPTVREPSVITRKAGQGLAVFGKGLGFVGIGIGYAIYGVFFAVWIVARTIGRGALFAGRFMVEGHHSIKYRTCPRIEVMSEP